MRRCRGRRVVSFIAAVGIVLTAEKSVGRAGLGRAPGPRVRAAFCDLRTDEQAGVRRAGALGNDRAAEAELRLPRCSRLPLPPACRPRFMRPCRRRRCRGCSGSFVRALARAPLRPGGGLLAMFGRCLGDAGGRAAAAPAAKRPSLAALLCSPTRRIGPVAATLAALRTSRIAIARDGDWQAACLAVL